MKKKVLPKKGTKKRHITNKIQLHHDEFRLDMRHMLIYGVALAIIVLGLFYLVKPFQEQILDAPKLSDDESRLVEGSLGRAFEVVKDEPRLAGLLSFNIMMFFIVGFVLGTVVYQIHKKKYS